ncbi:uncharacterized protein EHS24_002776 [Apiotrichum porosum]|uniref:UBR-type domain-containing protein n=1 Tax=Apiotrichum porosum TaxID=105984 RepID=A0A427XHT6_9TREE|nr:uncharacterized protein EHS24_002776 [Apiotrichum porosum]RSH78307.1 hypothetical protein EHS24_002776 [Apiotrichum porosum]
MAAFSVLPTDYLATQPGSSEMTLQNLIDTQDRLAEEAREVLPYSFDECTYSKGYLRQSVWSCLDCGEKGVCYGCSISCHSDHRLVELWTKRSFQCDCPTSAMCPSEGPSKRRCSLNPPEQQPQAPNDRNHYGQTFSGKFCRCGRDYDPETEIEAMVTCIACEDWFHESCLNLQPRPEPREDVDDDEDEESDCLIPSDSYDGLICAECAKLHPLLAERSGTDGWMIIEPHDKEGEWKVVGKKMAGSKRANEEDCGSDPKRARVEDAPAESDHPTVVSAPPVEADGVVPTETAEAVAPVPAAARKGAGDIFLAHGIREELKAQLDAATAAALPFPLEDEEIYEPPKDEDKVETLEEVTERVVSTLPRVQAIEALHGYQAMKDKLKVMLAAHAQSGEAVSREDIEGFFEELRQAKK